MPPRHLLISTTYLLLTSLLFDIAASEIETVPVRTPLSAAAGPDAYLDRDYNTVVLPWNLKTTVEAYRQHGQRDPAWNDTAETFLTAWAHLFTGLEIEQDKGALLVLAEQLGEVDCRDPMVSYCRGKTYAWFDEHRKQSKDCFRQAYRAFKKSDHPAARKAWATYRILEQDFNKKGHRTGKKQRGLAEEYAAFFATSIAQQEYQGIERLMVEHVTSNSAGCVHERQLVYDAIAEAVEPHRDSWYGATILGWAEMGRAWGARGTGWASTVTEEGWRGFADHMGKAAALLGRAYEQAPEHPIAATLMITVALSHQSRLSNRQWFDRAVAAQFDYRDAYDRLRWSLAPRWGGSAHQLVSFAKACIATDRFDTFVPTTLLDVLHDIHKEAKKLERPAIASAIFDNDQAWQLSADLLDRLSADPEREALWFRSYKAALAARFGKQDLARELVAEIGEDIYTRPFTTYDIDLDALQVTATADGF